MSRKSLYIFITCLLYLLPALSFAQSLTLYEYWFDDDFGSRISGSLSGANTVVNTSIDANQLDNGVHKFSFRAKQSDGKFSAVSSSLFLKRTAAQGSQVEYWFDDNFDQRDSLDILNTEEEQELSLDLRSNTKYPMGFHKLNMRVTLEGEGESAIYSSDVVKLSAGKANRLEYWIDDDIAHSQTIEGKPSSDGSLYQFLTDLNLSGVTPGYHRLYCRAVSTSKQTSGAISMTPIMVKPKDYSAEGLTMESYSFTVDDKTPVEIPIVNKKEGVNIPYTLDARNLSLGEHKLKASFKNSLGISTMIEESFTVVPPENPSIELKGWCFDDWLHLDFNSIPNDVSYKIMEIGADGIEQIVYGLVASAFPDTIKALPEPITYGVATYYVIATYIDRYGHEQEVRSNKVTLKNTSPPASSLYGCIVGRIQFDNQTLLTPHKHIYVNMSDGKNVEKVLVNPNGTFNRDLIPFGTTMTLSIDDDDYYNYESITVNVDKDTRNQVQVIKATAHDDVADNVSNENVELTVKSFSWDDRTFSFEVMNTSSSYQTFSGTLEMIAFKSKKNQDVVFDPTKPYYHAGSGYIKNLNYGKTTNVSITLDNLPKLKKNEYFTFYFVTQKDEQSMTKQYKQLVFEDNRFTNPMTLPISPDPTIDDVEFADMDAFIMEVIKIMKDMDKWDGPMYKELKHIAETYDNYKENDNYMVLSTKLGTGLLFSFCNDLRDAYKDASKTTKPIREFYENMRDVATFSDKKPFDNFITVCKHIFKLYKKVEKIGGVSTNPFLEIYTLYLEAAEHAVEKIEEYQKDLTDIQLGDIFYNGKITFRIKMYKEKEFWYDLNPTYYIPAKDIAANINSIQIYLVNDIDQVEMATYTATGSDDSYEVILIRDKEPTPYDHGYRSKRFWMEIIWNNGRVSRFPLYDKFTDWDRKGQDVRNITLTLRTPSYSMDKVYLDY